MIAEAAQPFGQWLDEEVDKLCLRVLDVYGDEEHGALAERVRCRVEVTTADGPLGIDTERRRS